MWNTFCKPMERNLSAIKVNHNENDEEISILISNKNKCEIYLKNYEYNEQFLRELYYHFNRYLCVKNGIIWNQDHEVYDSLIDHEKEAMNKILEIKNELTKLLIKDTKYWQNSFQYIYELWINFSNYIMVIVL